MSGGLGMMASAVFNPEPVKPSAGFPTTLTNKPSVSTWKPKNAVKAPEEEVKKTEIEVVIQPMVEKK
jgi:hypothetical protein